MNGSSEQKWYAEGLRFECRRCGACCTGKAGYVWVMEREAERMTWFLGISISEFGGKYVRKAGSYDSLIELPDGRCIFYADHTCKVHPVRPLQCETFPFWR